MAPAGVSLLLALAHAAAAHLGAHGLRSRGPGEREPLDVAGRADSHSAGDLFKPIVFNRQLLICNAYPSKSPMSLSKNGKQLLTGNDALRFGECRDIDVGILAKDKL